MRTYINLILTMLLGGLWHGANWTFIIWGAWHGGLMALERALGAKQDSPYPRLIALPLTFLLVVIGWVMFRAENVAVAMQVYGGMLGLNGVPVREALQWQLESFQLATLLLAFGLVFVVPLWRSHSLRWTPERLLQAGLVPLFVLAVLKLSAQSYSPFLYFQF